MKILKIHKNANTMKTPLSIKKLERAIKELMQCTQTDQAVSLMLDYQKAIDKLKNDQETDNDIIPITDNSYIMFRDWFKKSDDGNGGIIFMAQCPNCGDAIVYGEGCINHCGAEFEYK